MTNCLTYLFVMLSLSALGAVNTTTPGPVTVLATFQCISVKGWFTNDANANNNATIQFMVHGSGGPLLSAYTTTIDRYTNQVRGSIVGLTPNTSYDVITTWSDPDGVVGTAAITNTISTLSYSPPLGGSTINVTDDASLASALSAVVAGQTIQLSNFTYKPFTVSVSGNSGAYIKINGAANGASVIEGTNINQNLHISGSFLVVSGFTLDNSDHSAVIIDAGLQGLFVQGCTAVNISTTCATNAVSNYSDCGVSIGTGCSNIFILQNTIASAALNNGACTLSPSYQSPGTGISWHAITSLVVQSNTLIGGFRDAISQDDSAIVTENVDLTKNYMGQYKDDGVESKGLDVNVRVWSNWITNLCGNTFFAFNDNTITNPAGPLYVFRDFGMSLASNTNAGAIYKLGVYCPPSFFFHETIDASQVTTGDNIDGFSAGSPVTIKNSILKLRGSGILASPTGTTADYDLYDETTGNYVVYKWNGTIVGWDIVGFRTGASQETHGISGDPLLNSDLTIPKTSPAVDAGVVIPNFNDATSAWPFSGTAPDIGAFEYVPPPGNAIIFSGSHLISGSTRMSAGP